MADPVPAGSDVSAGTYRCTDCGYELSVASTKSLPPCPDCKRLVAHGDRRGQRQ
jgi:predicted Zn-ribbon and HTH transcriptional regulator